MSIPDAAVSFLLENIAQILSYNYKLIANVKENMVALQQELETLRDVMRDFSKYNHDSEYLRGIVKRITKVICQAEDALDTYLLHVTVQKSRSWLSKAYHNISDYPKALRDVGKRIEEISNEVRKINQENATKGFQILQHQAILQLNRVASPKQAPIVEEDHVVGFERATEEISKLLTGGPEQFEVISIVGMLGLGKTTLAKKALKDPKVDYEYRIRPFVYVSQEYEKKEVYLKILGSFTQITDDVNKMTEDKLEEHLQKELSGKQYLIVLDDVWEKEDWDRLKGAFPNNKNKRCRVLITTRNEEVAKHANKKIPFYKLDFLPPAKSRELLRWKVFEDSEFPQELREYEIQIAAKCDGLPLAIVVISGILLNNRESDDWWKHVADSVKDYIARDDKQTTKVIGLMYMNLPNHLKQCFLYMGVFREDFEIPVWKLVRLWISEGLIQEERDLNLEDIAEQNLNELVYRNLVMVGRRSSNEKIKTCRMHDTLREFCKNQAKEENLFLEIKKEKLPLLSKKEESSECRRICINNVNVLDYFSSSPSGKCARSFLSFNKEETAIEPKWVASIPKTFKLLKVLEIESLVYSRFPVELPDLVLLKYIAISSQFSTLPAAMSGLKNLQTLIVNTTCRTLDIRANIWEMPQLRHLHTNASTILPSPPLENINQRGGRVESLIQTLSTISPDCCGTEFFLRAPKLKKLGICGTLMNLFQAGGQWSSFGNLRIYLRSLENLKLLNDNVDTPNYAFPSLEIFPQQLTKLTLLNTLLEWKEMSTIGKLPKLAVLKLKEHAFRGQLWETEKGGFPLLKHLHIGRTDLMVWEASVEHFPKLKCLQLFNCEKLQAVPHGLADIPSLEMVVLHCTNTSVASSARRLQVWKLEEAKRDNKSSTFKLSIYPPQH